jgi:DNA-binding XRE family transcriptional regulator
MRLSNINSLLTITTYILIFFRMSRVAEVLVEARKAAGLTQRQLAELIGVTQATLANIELGKRPLPRERMAKLPPAIRRKVIDAVIAEFRAMR